MDRLTIFRKGLLLIAVPLCFQLLFIGLVATMRRSNTESARWAIHSNEVMAQAESCGYRILSAHGAIQGFIITRDAMFARELRRLVAASRAELAKLVTLVAADPAQTLAARRIETKATALLDFMEEGARMVEGPGMPPQSATTRRRYSQTLLEAMSGELSRFVADEQTQITLRRSHLEAAWNRLDVLLVGGLLISILSSVLIAFLYSRSISGRIGTLASNTQLLSEGRDLMPALAGVDEIARLDAVFRRMAATLDLALKRERAAAEEMAEVNVQLRDKAQENEMFVYSVSHDLRSPLVNLQGFSKELGLLSQDLLQAVDRDEVPDNIRKQVRSLIASDMKESIGFIQSAVTRLSGIIDALLRLSRSGRVEYHPILVDVEPVVARIVRALRGTIDERGAQVIVHDLLPACADPSAIEQVFANLIGNAVNYLDPDRPGRVEVAARRVEGSGGESSVVYSVSDNGLGIAESYHGKIFTAFQRLHGNVAKGEGIGLALIRRVVERNHGRVWFESAEGRGTTFFVEFPVERTPTQPISRASAESAVADRLEEVR